MLASRDMRDANGEVRPGVPAIADVLRSYWGFESLRPIQAEAIEAGIAGRDSLVVMPTGGGKSLCYQVPPLVAKRTDVVVSPLISLMKDQVDGLRACGYPAAAVYSDMRADEKREIARALRAGALRLLFVAPERLMTPKMLDFLRTLDIRAFAIDEAHCISQWGHDFRPIYRQLADLRGHFPQATLHGFTATATPRVRDDIAQQLGLREPDVLVGRFDRRNLVYRVVDKLDVEQQVLEAIRRREGDAVIVYCISRKEAESLATVLERHGVRAACYHAGLSAQQRHETQERFAREQLDVVVATVAFGMGIDRSNVRCVIHAALPKSIEHYQQETGRAGRDGLEAECVLLYSAGDAIRWEQLIDKSNEEARVSAEVARASRALLMEMRGFAASLVCRHKALSEYFGQAYGQENCGACDVCLDEHESDPEAMAVAQQVLTCVREVEQRFGVVHVVNVLRGAKDQRIRSFGHDALGSHGALGHLAEKTVKSVVYQLIDQGVLDRTETDRPLLKLNHQSALVMQGERAVRLKVSVPRNVKAARLAVDDWAGVDRVLFESLRELRKTIASERQVPAFVVFGDRTLRDMARRRPRKTDELLACHGVGRQKLEQFGKRFAAHIAAYLDGESA